MVLEFCIPGESTPDRFCSAAFVFGSGVFDLAEPRSRSLPGLGPLKD